jgi:hypothetical protein
MHLIAYTSRYSGDTANIEGVLADIVKSAKAANPKRGITGVLFFDRDRFVQVIEGEQSALNDLLELIKKDERHDDVQVIFNGEEDHQEFSEWNMDAFQLSGASQFVDEDVLKNFRKLYLANFKLSSGQISRWIKMLINEPERFVRVFNDGD